MTCYISHGDLWEGQIIKLLFVPDKYVADKMPKTPASFMSIVNNSLKGVAGWQKDYSQGSNYSNVDITSKFNF